MQCATQNHVLMCLWICADIKHINIIIIIMIERWLREREREIIMTVEREGLRGNNGNGGGGC